MEEMRKAAEDNESRPARDGWIEIAIAKLKAQSKQVPSREGRVD